MIVWIVETAIICLIILAVLLWERLYVILCEVCWRLGLPTTGSGSSLLSWQSDQNEWEVFRQWATSYLSGHRRGFLATMWGRLLIAMVLALGLISELRRWFEWSAHGRPWLLVIVQLVIAGGLFYLMDRWTVSLAAGLGRCAPRYELKARSIYTVGGWLCVTDRQLKVASIYAIMAWPIIFVARHGSIPMRAVPWRWLAGWGEVKPGIWIRMSHGRSILNTLIVLVCVPPYLRGQVGALIEQNCPGKRLATAPLELTEPAIAPSR